MRTVILAIDSFKENASVIGGPDALIFTPSDHDIGALTECDLLMVFLHPSPDGLAWIDETGRVVLDGGQVANWHLSNTVVLLGTCYGLENKAMITALKLAGARAIIAGSGENYGGAGGLAGGVDVMARTLRVCLEAGLRLEAAWQISRAATWLAARRGVPGAQDALGFILMATEQANNKARWGWLAVILSFLLVVFGATSTQTLTFTSPPSPIDTPMPTYTPWYTPQGWGLYEATVVFATPTACVFGCGPTPGARIMYALYLPLVYNNYEE